MNCLSTFDDAFLNRMSVAICSILAARISTVETSMIGAQPEYMIKLLSMVRSKVVNKSVDITMKFTLSALWNLTDESATTCKVFLQKGGLKLFLEVLECFKGECSVETKVLGLINNIAEVCPCFSCIASSLFGSVGHALGFAGRVSEKTTDAMAFPENSVVALGFGVHRRVVLRWWSSGSFAE